jgi:hypothetical protein
MAHAGFACRYVKICFQTFGKIKSFVCFAQKHRGGKKNHPRDESKHAGDESKHAREIANMRVKEENHAGDESKHAGNESKHAREIANMRVKEKNHVRDENKHARDEKNHAGEKKKRLYVFGRFSHKNFFRRRRRIKNRRINFLIIRGVIYQKGVGAIFANTVFASWQACF